MRSLLLAAIAAAVLAASAGASNPALLHPSKLNATAPATYKAKFTTTKGAFVITVYRKWSPRGADRFYNLVANGFYDGQRLFRDVPGQFLQWGISGDPKVSKAWLNATIKDDPFKVSNIPATVDFATSGPNTRTTQVFVNLGSNTFLDTQGFTPFGRVTSDMTAIAKLYHGYGDKPTNEQPQMYEQGEKFFAKSFPKLDRILTARIVH